MALQVRVDALVFQLLTSMYPQMLILFLIVLSLDIQCIFNLFSTSAIGWGCPDLTKLEIKGSILLEDDGIAAIARGCSKLQVI